MPRHGLLLFLRCTTHSRETARIARYVGLSLICIPTKLEVANAEHFIIMHKFCNFFAAKILDHIFKEREREREREREIERKREREKEEINKGIDKF